MFFYQGPRNGDVQILKDMFSGEGPSKKRFVVIPAEKLSSKFTFSTSGKITSSG